MAIFRIFKMAAAAILVFGFGNMHVFRFREFGLKMPIHAKKTFFLEDLTP